MKALVLAALLIFINVLAAQEPPIIEYGRQCAALIMEVPTFSCGDGVVLPITVNGKTPEKYFPSMTCDHPAMAPMLPGKSFVCAPYSRVLLLRDDQVQASAYCRQMSLRTATSPYYDEIDVVIHSRVNGATCWFSATTTTAQGISGNNVPPPTSKEAPAFWDPPAKVVQGQCVSCHDSDPWMYSPYLGQTNAYPVDPFGYYTNAVGPFKEWLQPSGLTARGNNCSSCHRIGNMETCKTTMLQAAGRLPIAGTDQQAQKYPASHWMPPSNPLTHAQWDITYDHAIRQLQTCCANPNAPGCEVVTIEGKLP